MSQAPPDPEPLLRALLRTRICVLVTLGAVGLVLAFQPAGTDAPVDPNSTAIALALAMGSIVARHLSARPTRAPRSAFGSALASLLLALSVGGLGLTLAFAHDARETGILLAFGGFILATPRPRIPALARNSNATNG
jgi:hypothetical protein